MDTACLRAPWKVGVRPMVQTGPRATLAQAYGSRGVKAPVAKLCLSDAWAVREEEALDSRREERRCPVFPEGKRFPLWDRVVFEPEPWTSIKEGALFFLKVFGQI